MVNSKLVVLLERFNKKFCSRYEYSNITSYQSLRNTKLPIICKKHGLFYQTAASHLASVVGCPKCAQETGFYKPKGCKSFLSDKDKLNISNSLKKYYSSLSLEKRKDIEVKRQAALHTPQAKKNQSDAQKRRFERPAEIEASRQRALIIQNNPKIRRCVHLTKKKNKTHNTSKPEQQAQILLEKKFKEVIPQYYSDRYPFSCDFYIPDQDLFIECNFFWTHGTEPFNSSNPKHQEQLNRWHERSKELNFKGKPKVAFKNAIKVWTEKDPFKVKIAQENNLNLKVFYSYQSLIMWDKE